MSSYVRNIALAMILCGITAPLCAQGVKRDPQRSETSYQINIPAGTLVQALDKLGAQARMQILYAPDLADGVKVQAINGMLTFRTALTQLLASTTLMVESVNEKTVVLKRSSGSTSSHNPGDQMQ